MDQSPFAIEDLMKELETGSDVDSSSEHEKWSDQEDTEMAKGEDLVSLTLALETSRKIIPVFSAQNVLLALYRKFCESKSPVHLEGNGN